MSSFFSSGGVTNDFSTTFLTDGFVALTLGLATGVGEALGFAAGAGELALTLGLATGVGDVTLGFETGAGEAAFAVSGGDAGLMAENGDVTLGLTTAGGVMHLTTGGGFGGSFTAAGAAEFRFFPPDDEEDELEEEEDEEDDPDDEADDVDIVRSGAFFALCSFFCLGASVSVLGATGFAFCCGVGEVCGLRPFRTLRLAPSTR